ncbi:hypothetical protein [Paenibacillus chitinolyticus]|uniref:hypothetical protein n=1 Tax=Paenibacillus chitinolyticus TaxID=79263 RepID=UPI003CFFF121
MEKQTIAQVKATIRREGTWTGKLCPSNFYPDSPWGIAAEKTFTREDLKPINEGRENMPQTEFESYCNSFSYYNCNNEMGKRIHFYRTDAPPTK